MAEKYHEQFFIRILKAHFTIAILAMLFLVFCLECFDELQLSSIERQPETWPQGQLSIVINVSNRTLELYNDSKLYKKYRIAVGKSRTPSPIGEWKIVYKDYSDKEIFGTRWLGLNVPWGGYGIHGTNRPWSIGQFASQGCIRLRNKDIEELFEWVPLGTKVKIEGAKVKVSRKLKYQDVGADVVMLQIKLKKFGYFSGPADGIFGKLTEEAVKELQQEHGWERTGIVDKKICRILGL